MKKILIALDYDLSSEKVAEAGYALAKALHAEVTLVHVVKDPVYYAAEYSPIKGYQGAYTEETVAEFNNIRIEAGKFLAAAASHLGDENIKIKALDGETANAILEYSKNSEADLIVLGSHRHKGLERLFVTDVTAYILKHSKIPLFIIPTADE